MSLKRVIILLSLLGFSCVGAFAQGVVFSSNQRDFISCARERLFVVYDFLDARKPVDQKVFTPNFCPQTKKPIKVPAWLQEELPSMAENEVWSIPQEDGTKKTLTENDVWLRPINVMYNMLDLAEDIDRDALTNDKIMKAFASNRQHMVVSLERLKTNPEIMSYDLRDSMEGRGRSLIATFDLALKEMDTMSESFLARNWKPKFKAATLSLATLANLVYGDIIIRPAPQDIPLNPKQKRGNKLLIGILMAIGTLLVFSAAYMFVESKNAQVSMLVQEYLQKSTTWADDYSRQFLDINVKYIVLGTLAVFCIFGIFFAIAAGGFFGIFMFMVFFTLGLTVGLKMPGVILDSLKKKRGAQINKQLMDALILMSNALKSGMDIVQGFEMVSSDLRPPISDEFGLVIKNYKLGTPFEKSLENMEERIESRLLSYMVKAIILQRQVGGNLTKIFERIVENIREESKLEDKLQAMTAQQRIQSLVVSIMPWLMVAVLFVFQPDVMIKFYTKFTGVMVLFFCIVWIFIGMKMVRKLGEIKV